MLVKIVKFSDIDNQCWSALRFVGQCRQCSKIETRKDYKGCQLPEAKHARVLLAQEKIESDRKAAFLDLRFQSGRGLLTVTDVVSLSLRDIDRLAQEVNKKLKANSEESFLSSSVSKTKETAVLELQLEILKDIIATKELAEAKRKERAERRATIAQLKELAAQKSTEALASTSLEDIQKKLAELAAEDEALDAE